jgi:hypothetical protein
MSIEGTLTALAGYGGIGGRVPGPAPGSGEVATVSGHRTVAISPPVRVAADRDTAIAAVHGLV